MKHTTAIAALVSMALQAMLTLGAITTTLEYEDARETNTLAVLRTEIAAKANAIEMDVDYSPYLLVSVDESGNPVISEYSADMFAEWDHTHTPQSIGAAPAQTVSYSFESPNISTNDIWLWQFNPSIDPTNIIPLVWRDDMHGWCHRFSNNTTLCLECFTGEWNGYHYTDYWLMWAGSNYAKTKVLTYFDDTTPNEFVLDNRHLFRAGAGTNLPITSFYVTNTVVYTDTLAASTSGVARAVAAAYKPKQSAVASPSAATTEAYQFIDTIAQDTNGVITATKKTMRKATTSAPGMVQLNDNIDSTRTDHAATANALRIVAEKADAAIDAANAAEASASSANTKATAVATASTNYTDSVVAPIWSYVLGDTVWFAVTNYMRTISGVAPALQLWEVRDGATNLIYSSTEEISNLVAKAVAPLATTQDLHEVQAALPSKAWSRYQSATGADNPEPSTVTIVSTPVVQLTGGGEWQPHTLVAGGTVWTLESNGITTIGGGTNGNLVIRNTITGEEVFSVEERSFIPSVPVLDSFTPKSGGDGFIFSVYADTRPTLYTATNLTERVKVAWDAEGDDPNVIVNSWTNNGDGTWTVDVSLVVPSASYYAYVGVTESTESIISNKRAVSFDGGVYVDSAKWRLGTATISGVRVLTLEAMP